MTTTLVTGGCRSGKSRHALGLLAHCQHRVFIATAQAFDEEMRSRISAHQHERGDTFTTIEEPLDPASALDRLPSGTDGALLDCVTLWLTNLLLREGAMPEIDALLDRLARPGPDLVLVTNELGMGLVPDTPLGRRFRDLAGSVNQRLAAACDRVVFMVCGLPMVLK